VHALNYQLDFGSQPVKWHGRFFDNFAGLNAVTTVLRYQDHNAAEQTATLPLPVFHLLGLLSDMGERYWVLPQHNLEGHVAGGFASRDQQGTIRVLLFTHNAQDTQSRSGASFAVTLGLAGLDWIGTASVQEYRFDHEHNSPFELIKKIAAKRVKKDGSTGPIFYTKDQFKHCWQLCQSHPTRSYQVRSAAGRLQFDTALGANGCNFLLIKCHADPLVRPRVKDD
jgi:hypothetical protein